ncbi:hypothetical protein C9374_011910 [Naegleria lovaniensis]|uniref:Uncharacterized protein n=1 Tax=Naegleria lovaniensis TaxID=51637 RepID=A0AA88GGG3_NAELO|nr:uncharacterized protein C9374_011910 [Naegleria lovaniensis]KAG2373621.1 hypothetical protein C9374_011910 [Naegleria lovaniensis]
MIIHDDLYEWLNLNYKKERKEERNHHEFENQWIVVNDEDDKLSNMISKNSKVEEIDEGKLMDITKDGREFQCLSLKCNRTGFEVNVNLFKYCAFRKRLEQNWLQALMCVNMDTKKFVWRIDFPELSSCYKIYFRRLVVSAITEAGGHFRLAKKYWNDKSNNHYRSKKYIAHTFRDLMLARQLIHQLKIVDYTEANDIYYELLNRQFENEDIWKTYENEYYPRYQHLKEEINAMTMQPKDVQFDLSKRKETSQLFQYLQQFKNVQELSEMLRLYFSLESTFFTSDNGVQYWYIRGINDETPFYSDVSNECFNGIILSRLSDDMDFEMLCLPLRRVIPSDNHYCYQFKSNEGCYIWTIESNVTHHTLILVHLFYNPNDSKWQICSNMTYSANETIYGGESEQHLLSDLFWREFERRGLKFPTRKDVTLTFECSSNYSRRRNNHACVDDNSVHFFIISITELHSQCFVDLKSFIEECHFETNISFEPKVKSLAHLKTLAIRFNPVLFKEIVIYGTKDGPLSYALPQYVLLTTTINTSGGSSDKYKSLILEIARTSLGVDEKTYERIGHYVENVVHSDFVHYLATLQTNCFSLIKILVTYFTKQLDSSHMESSKAKSSSFVTEVMKHLKDNTHEQFVTRFMLELFTKVLKQRKENQNIDVAQIISRYLVCHVDGDTFSKVYYSFFD